MKFRNILVLVTIVALLSTMVMAKNDNDMGKKLGQNKSDVNETTSTIGRGRGFQKHNKSDARNETRVRNETHGALISEIQQVRKEQFRLMKDEFKGMGYHGEVNDFAVAFNRQLKQLKFQIRERLNSSDDSNLTRAVMRETARRELTRIREERMAGLNISEKDVRRGLRNLSGLNENFSKEIRNMNRGFRANILEVARNGTVEEKKALKQQIREYVAERKTEIRLLRDKIKLQRRLVRRLLGGNMSAGDIAENLSA